MQTLLPFELIHMKYASQALASRWRVRGCFLEPGYQEPIALDDNTVVFIHYDKNKFHPNL